MNLKSKNNALLFSLVIIGFLLVSSILINKISAQLDAASQGLEVSPPSQEIQADPGTTIIVKSKLRNISNNTLPINVTIQDFTATGNEGQVALTDKSPYSITSWTKVTPEHFTIGPGATQEVSATITIPKDGAAGGRYGSFLFSVGTVEKGGQASLSQQVASLFLVRISGPVSESLYVKEFSAPQFSEFGPIPFQLKFSNNGNVYVKVFGLINVTDMLGNKVADIVVRGTNVFPGADRIVTATLNNHFLIGEYKVNGILYFGSKNETLLASTRFFAFPIRIAAVIIICLFILFLLRKRLLKAYKVLMGR